MTRRCPACGKKVDPLRAGHVAIFDDRFHYFCDRGCREDWLEGGRPNRASLRGSSFPSHRPPAFSTSLPSIPPLAPPPSFFPAFSPSPTPTLSPAPSPSPSPTLSPSLSPTPPPSPDPAPDWTALPAPPPSLDFGAPLLAVAFGCGLLGATLLLAGPSSVIEAARIAIAFAGWIALLVRALALPEDPADPHRAVVLAPGLAAASVAAYAWLVGDPGHLLAATFAGLVVATTAGTTYLVARGRKTLRQEAERLAAALGLEESWIAALSPGETVLVEAGATVPVDGTVLEGSATVQPWAMAATTTQKREGDAIVAGATVLDGSLRVVATVTGLNRAWARLSLDPRNRADVSAPIAKASKRLATQGALAAAALMTLAGLSNGARGVELLLCAIAGFVALGVASVGGIASTHIARGILQAHRRGIAYRHAQDWDRAAGASVAAFCARGVLLLDEPELTDLELTGSLDANRLLALVAGVESAKIDDPIARAIHRAAAARGIRPDAVRSPMPQPGLGVTAVASSGESLVVGSRALMLREKISIAAAETIAADMEAQGRTVLLVGLGGKLVGVLGLQDDLHPSARASVQHLLDAQIEPVLLSGDARETCEAIGRALDIEHLRPEILPADRTREIERLAGGGATVAVIGRAGRDDTVLAAASVSVALGGAGGQASEFAVSIASDQVKDCALALTLAQRARFQARTGLALAIAPGALAALAVAFGMVSPSYVPVAVLAGALAMTFHARATDSLRDAGR